MRKRKSPGKTPDQPKVDSSAESGPSRRDFLRSGAVGLAAVAAGSAGSATTALAGSGVKEVVRNLDPPRKLLKGGVVLTLDPNVGDFEKADVLVEGKKIVAVGPNLRAGAQVIDCTGTIVVPGFISTHHHQYYTIQRGINADGYIVFGANPPNPFQQ